MQGALGTEFFAQLAPASDELLIAGAPTYSNRAPSVENLSSRRGYNQSFSMSYQVEQGCGREGSGSPHAKS